MCCAGVWRRACARGRSSAVALGPLWPLEGSRTHQEASALLQPLVPSNDGALAEVAHYLFHSFGNKQRIDYGTGHEAHFLVLL